MPNYAAIRQIVDVLGTRDLKGGSPALLERLRSPGTFLEVARELLQEDATGLEYLGDIPVSIQEAIRAAVAQAIDEGRPVHVSFAPAYDFGVEVSDFVSAVGIHVRGPYARPYARDGYEASG